MRFAPTFLAILAAASSGACVLLDVSGVYKLIIGGAALDNASPTGPISFGTSAGTPTQAWSVVVTPGTAFVTLQNMFTRAFVAADSSNRVVASTTAFSWEVLELNGQNLLCTSGGLCISLVQANIGLAALGSSVPQTFIANPTVPPNGFYQIQNQASNVVFGNSAVPGSAFLVPFPAVDRTEIWQVSSTGSSAVALSDFDTEGFLSVASNNSVGAFERTSRFAWNVLYVSGVGALLSASEGFLSVTNWNLRIGNAIDTTAAWVFRPVNASAFLP